MRNFNFFSGKRIFITLCCLFVLLSHAAGKKKEADFVRAVGTQFEWKGKPYKFIGTNFWYAPILASKGQGGDRKRLKKELNRLQELGINNLRILVGAEEFESTNTVRPALQNKEYQLNDTLLDGLDFLLKEMEKRNMVGVFYLTNAWDWSGGIPFYLEQTGHGKAPDATKVWDDYCNYAAQFYSDEAAMQHFYDFVKKIITRKNRYTRRYYKDEPAIMAWQLCNEPRPFVASQKENMLNWTINASRLIKELDPNHLVSTGSEGTIGCLFDVSFFEQIHSNPNIDYLTAHVWPVNWRWSSADRLQSALNNVYLRTREYLQIQLRSARHLDKPLVIEEFGYPRDNSLYSADATTYSRNQFYRFMFDLLIDGIETEDVKPAGCNFWGWGGEGRPQSQQWYLGNDYLCDPPHEPQGWYSVYSTDTDMLKIIKNYTLKVNGTKSR